MKTSPSSPIFFKRVAGTFAALVVAAVAAFPAAPASAQTAPAARDEIRIEVKGQTPDTVRRQIKAAASDVCREAATHSPILPRETAECRRETEKQAIAQLGDAPRQMAAR